MNTNTETAITVTAVLSRYLSGKNLIDAATEMVTILDARETPISLSDIAKESVRTTFRDGAFMRVAAVKSFRDRTGMTLRDSLTFIDRAAADLGIRGIGTN